MKLFKEAEIEKTATLAMASDANKWTKEILTEFLSIFPMLQQVPVNVIWKKRDETKGYGVGSISILNGAVPVIIKDFKAFPFDIITLPDKTIPLDTITINELMSNDNPFVGALDAKSKDSLRLFGDLNQQWSPNDYSSYSQTSTGETRPGIKIAGFIDNISTFDYKDMKKIAEVLKEDQKLAELVTNSENITKTLSKVASKVKNYNNYWLETVKKADLDRQLIYKDKDGNTFVKQAFSGIDKVNDTLINQEEEESLNNLFAPLTKIASAEQEDTFIQSESIEKGMEGYFRDTKGNTTGKCYIIDIEKTAAMEDYMVVPVDAYRSLIIDKYGSFAVLEVPTLKAINIEKILEKVETKPKVDDKGVFIVKGRATRVFTIKQIIPNMAEIGKFEIIATRNDGLDETFVLMKNNRDAITQDPKDFTKYWVPGNAVFVKLSSRFSTYEAEKIKKFVKEHDEFSGYKMSVLENFKPRKYSLKLAKEIDNDNNIIPLDAEFGLVKKSSKEYSMSDITANNHEIMRDMAGRYHLFGPEFDKYANLGHEVRNLTVDEVKWPIIHNGITADEYDVVVNLPRGGEIKLASKLQAPKSLDEFIKQAEKLSSPLTDDLSIQVIPDFLKFAAKYEEDQNTVDAVLSLGLINKFNIIEYLDLIPDYDRLLAELTKLLLFVRLSSLSIDEKILSALVSYLNRVIYGLKTIKATINSRHSTESKL